MIIRIIKNIIFLIILLFVSGKCFSTKIIRICISGDDINIFWSKYNDTCNGFISYQIYGRLNEFAAYNLINTVTDINTLDYTHNGAKKLSTKWNYYINIKIFCNGKNYDIITDTASIDQEIPLSVEIDTVSVVNNKIIIGWNSCNSSDTKGYLLYYVDNNGNNIIIDTIYGRFVTQYIDSKTGNPNIKIIRYRLAAMDSCENISIISGQHNNILYFINQDTCKQTILLSWNSYAYWRVQDYQFIIYYKINGGNYQILDSVNGNILNYSLNNPQNKTTYSFFIRAKNKVTGYTSTSNISGITTDFIVNPDYIYLKKVSVTGNDLDINWIINKTAELKGFNIYKEESGLLNFVKMLKYNSVTDYSFTDSIVNINNSIYVYKITTVDFCNNEKLQSNLSRNILLKKTETGNGFMLQWNDYYSWYGGIKGYNIYRMDSENPNWYKENSVDENTLQYNENMNSTNIKGKNICYYIEAIEGDTNKYGYKETSKSNTVCLYGSPIIYIPNAFSPNGDGYNDTFKIIAENIVNLKISIFNRWGEKIWYGEGVYTGWAGKNNSNIALPEGVYFYKIEIIGENKKTFSYSGTVTLIK